MFRIDEKQMKGEAAMPAATSFVLNVLTKFTNGENHKFQVVYRCIRQTVDIIFKKREQFQG